MTAFQLSTWIIIHICHYKNKHRSHERLHQSTNCSWNCLHDAHLRPTLQAHQDKSVQVVYKGPMNAHTKNRLLESISARNISKRTEWNWISSVQWRRYRTDAGRQTDTYTALNLRTETYNYITKMSPVKALTHSVRNVLTICLSAAP